MWRNNGVSIDQCANLTKRHANNNKEQQKAKQYIALEELSLWLVCRAIEKILVLTIVIFCKTNFTLLSEYYLIKARILLSDNILERFMKWKDEYKRKLCTPEAAVSQFVRSGDGIFGGGANVACTTLDALFRAIDAGDLDGITLHIHSFCNPGFTLERYDFTQEQLRVPTFFMNAPDRALLKKGQCTFVPLQYGMYERYMTQMKPRVSIVPMSLPDDEGYCNIGPNGYTPAGLEASEIIIAQVSRHVPRVNGACHRYHVSRIDAIVEADDELAVVDNPDATVVEKQIAEHILNYIPDGACIQLGIGGIANAVGFGLKGKRHLGVHTEVLTESIVDLIECGAVDNSRKKFLPGKTAVGFVLGSQRQYQFIDQNEALLFERFSQIVNIQNIASNDNMISINGAVSIDLTGQVCAESIGRRQYSGTGGQLDFVRGAALSKGGASFIAIPSTVKTKDGIISRIVLDLAPGSIVTTPRTDVQHVVTEYGVATLQFCDVSERVRQMISIAHPDFRDELMFQAKQAGIGYIY